MIPSQSLFQIFEANKEELIHKWEHYFEIYELYFPRYVGLKPRVLEIGVSQGGSLKMWSKYFGHESTIIGLDIDPRCLIFSSGNIEVVIGDQADREFLTRLGMEKGPFDIIIDDGGHTMTQQINSLETLLPYVSNTGIYLVEDLHTSYWSEFGGGLRKSGSFIEFAKTLIDQLNGRHIRGGNFDNTIAETVHSLAFYDSVLVVEKRPKSPHRSRATGNPSF